MRVGTFVVVRNVAPIITLFAEAALHPESAPRADLYTVGALSCIALGILFYELHGLGGSPTYSALIGHCALPGGGSPTYSDLVGYSALPGVARPLTRT